MKKLQLVNPALSNVAWGVLLAALFTGLLLIIYRSKVALRPAEYEGRIVEKWAGYNHSELGSFPYFRLMVETDNGQKMAVAVDKENYERAKVGMRIKKTQQGIELTRLELPKADGQLIVEQLTARRLDTEAPREGRDEPKSWLNHRSRQHQVRL